MTLYYTDKRTGEMTAILEPLRHKPRGKVKRLPSPRIAHQTTYHPPRRYNYRRPQPVGDLVLGLGATLLAAAVLFAQS